jgi:hypothetical protein
MLASSKTKEIYNLQKTLIAAKLAFSCTSFFNQNRQTNNMPINWFWNKNVINIDCGENDATAGLFVFLYELIAFCCKIHFGRLVKENNKTWHEKMRLLCHVCT